MRYSKVIAVLSGAAAVVAQGITDKIAPEGNPPEGCKPYVDGKFEIGIIEIGNQVKRDLALEKRATCSGEGILVAELSDSVIRDAVQRTGYIASNRQFQFDNPPQAGALYTAGFSHCANGSLALGSSTVFYQCRSGTFYNLYDEWTAEQCSPVEILIMPCTTEGDAATGGQGEGQVVGTSVVATTVVMPLSDGQPQVITTSKTVYICQITDGQIQEHTVPCTPAATTPPAAATSVPPVSQYSDGQIQVTPAAVPGASTLETVTTASGPVVVVPTGAPGVSGASKARAHVQGALLAAFGVGLALVVAN